MQCGGYDPQDAGAWFGGCAWENQALFEVDGMPAWTLSLPNILRGKTLYNYRVNGNALIIGGMNKDLTAMDAVTKKTRKNELLGAMWDYYIAQGLLNAPDEFYKDTDYENAPALPLAGENLEAYRKRGFLPTFNSYSGAQEEWYWGDYPWTQAKENDLKSFMLHLRNQTDEEVAWFLNNPEYELIQKKWNILIDYYKKEFGIDLRKMGNTTFE